MPDSTSTPSSSPSMDDLVHEMVDLAVCSGLCMALPTSDGSFHASHAPVSLLPTPMPRVLFEQAVSLAPLFNSLVDRIAQDPQWLHQIHDRVVEGDPFTARLVSISKQLLERPSQQSLRLGVHRSDYMLSQVSSPPADLSQPDLSQGLELKQVELNTIASSFGCLSSATTALHRRLLSRRGPLVAGKTWDASRLPPNQAREKIAAGIAQAHRLYGVQGAVVIFVVQPGERNVFDQRHLEQALFSEGVCVERRSLAEIAQQCSLRGEQQRLYLGEQEVSVVYFRAGYTPTDYPSELEWSARELVEFSYAVKCPTVRYQLAGTKKTQQALAHPAQLARFTSEQERVELAKCFTGLWSLDTPEEQAAARALVGSSEKFVLKPQREGGGNNIYGANVPLSLHSMSAEELSAHILMARLEPRTHKNVLLRLGKAHEVETLSELGIYGTFVGSDQGVHLNESAGFLLRTKLASSDEGGVAAGFAVLDTPYLQD